jgi:RNA-directed DNA polymerase
MESSKYLNNIYYKIINKIFTLEKLYQAYLNCRQTKRKTINALKFEWNLEKNLFKLYQELKTRKYRPGRSICFVIKDPVPREIFAASFKDRIIHHLLLNEVESIGERKFIFDSFACRKNKGTHLAIQRLRNFIRKATKNYKKEINYLQLDISGFFRNINYQVLFSLFEKMINQQNQSYQWKQDILWLSKIIIFHRPTDNYILKDNFDLFKLIPSHKSLFSASVNNGLAIGNYSSQFFANLYLNELDQLVKKKLRCKYYIRYVDDFIILNESKKKLKYWKNKIDFFLKRKLYLELNSKKTKLQSLDKGIDFLGYFIKLDYTLVRQKVVQRLKNKLYNYNINNIMNDINLDKFLAVINSYYGHFRLASSFNLRKNIYENYLGYFKKYFLCKNKYMFLSILKK